jgi:hypothetical protein
MDAATAHLEEKKKGLFLRKSDLGLTIPNQPFSNPQHCTCETDPATAIFRVNLHHPPHFSLTTQYLSLY